MEEPLLRYTDRRGESLVAAATILGTSLMLSVCIYLDVTMSEPKPHKEILQIVEYILAGAGVILIWNYDAWCAVLCSVLWSLALITIISLIHAHLQ